MVSHLRKCGLTGNPSFRSSPSVSMCEPTVTPSVALDDGVVAGSFNTTGTQNPLHYTVISGPNAGGKLQLNPDGSFSFLPYGTVVQDRGTESFTVMVSELPPLIAALAQVPLAGNLVESIVVALHRVPILGDLLQHLDDIPRDQTITTYCASGQRALIAASLLLQNGYTGVEVCLGSMEACKATDCPVEITRAKAS